MRIEVSDKIGFCFGVRRAINTLEKVAHERGGIETLGAVVHNQQVLQRLAEIGVRVAKDVNDIKGNIVATSSHGISPQLEEEIRKRGIDIINTTCPFVRRAQVAARRLADAGFFVVIYGDAGHPEVRGILGWAKGKGIATLDDKFIASFQGNTPRHVGILSQTTQVPALFTEFAKKVIDAALSKDSEIRIIDTICHDIRERQSAAVALAQEVDLMLVVGGRSSANTNRLAELCAAVTRTRLIETAKEIRSAWFKGKSSVGVTAGASTAQETVDNVLAKLQSLA